MQTPSDDKTFQQAIQELKARTTQILQQLVEDHAHNIMEKTVAEAIKDLDGSPYQEPVRTFLIGFKISLLLRYQQSQGILSQAELDELLAVIYPPQQEQGE